MGSIGARHTDLFAEPIIKQLSEKYHKDAGQIILRFENQEGVIVLPKSTHESRMISNKDIFDFELTEDEMEQMRSLDKGHGSHNPDDPGVEQMLLSAFDVHAND